MGFNTINQYVGNHKVWDHAGNVIPTVERQEGVRIDGMPAAWLPVKFYEKHFENWIVIMPGKVVGLDNDARLVPAGLGLTGATITYTANDVAAGVVDVRTGVALLTANLGTVTLSGVTTFMGRAGVTLAISKSVGIAQYAFLKWAGDGSAEDDGTNPALYVQHNYNMQHRVGFLTDYVIDLPVVPESQTAEHMTYASYASHIVTFAALSDLPVAKNTVRTPITFTDGTIALASTHFVNQVASADLIVALGDWYINLTTGVVKAYFASDPSSGYFHVAYSDYAAAPTGSNVSVFACALGDIKPGDFLKYNVDSNFVKATPLPVYGTAISATYDTDNVDWLYDDFSVIMGQVVAIDIYPRDLLERVRTYPINTIATNAAGSFPGYAGQMDQMPGTATGGMPALIHYAGAADTMVAVNLISR
jgi:hypothetical protein